MERQEVLQFVEVLVPGLHNDRGGSIYGMNNFSKAVNDYVSRLRRLGATDIVVHAPDSRTTQVVVLYRRKRPIYARKYE